MTSFLDLRAQQTEMGPPGACVVRHGKMVIRDPKTVDTLLIHQAAVRFGQKKGQPSRHHRSLGVHAHATAFDDGVFAFAYPLLAYVQHGNGSNSYSIGLEGEGLFNGLPGGKNAEPTALLIETMREACKRIVDEAHKEGATIKYVEAHRQHSATRTSDPGHGIWRHVVEEYCVPVLGLKTRPTRTTRDGKPIPKEWL